MNTPSTTTTSPEDRVRQHEDSVRRHARSTAAHLSRNAALEVIDMAKKQIEDDRALAAGTLTLGGRTERARVRAARKRALIRDEWVA